MVCAFFCVAVKNQKKKRKEAKNLEMKVKRKIKFNI